MNASVLLCFENNTRLLSCQVKFREMLKDLVLKRTEPLLHDAFVSRSDPILYNQQFFINDILKAKQILQEYK